MVAEKRMKLCPLCGEKVSTFTDDRCSACYRKKIIDKLSIRGISIKICSLCNTFFHKGKWKNLDVFNSTMLKEKDIVNQSSIPIMNPGIQKVIELDIVKEKTKLKLPIEILYTICPKCSKGQSTYLEGILQLRNPSSDLLEYVHRDISKHKAKGVFITKTEKLSNGLDLYITSKRYLRSLGNRLKKHFKGELNIAPQLFSRNRQKSKDIYRINVLFRM